MGRFWLLVTIPLRFYPEIESNWEPRSTRSGHWFATYLLLNTWCYRNPPHDLWAGSAIYFRESVFYGCQGCPCGSAFLHFNCPSWRHGYEPTSQFIKWSSKTTVSFDSRFTVFHLLVTRFKHFARMNGFTTVQVFFNEQFTIQGYIHPIYTPDSSNHWWMVGTSSSGDWWMMYRLGVHTHIDDTIHHLHSMSPYVVNINTVYNDLFNLSYPSKSSLHRVALVAYTRNKAF